MISIGYDFSPVWHASCIYNSMINSDRGDSTMTDAKAAMYRTATHKASGRIVSVDLLNIIEMDDSEPIVLFACYHNGETFIATDGELERFIL